MLRSKVEISICIELDFYATKVRRTDKRVKVLVLNLVSTKYGTQFKGIGSTDDLKIMTNTFSGLLETESRGCHKADRND